MSASPEFYRPAAPAFSPCGSPPRPGLGVGGGEEEYCYSCRTPTGSGVNYLREPTTCPPAPRKPPPPCKKRLFQGEVPLISLRLDELERIFRPQPPPPCDKRRRSARQQRKLDPTTTQLEASS
uniref:Uncharacterized protein n=1 Tax=Arundo donax TaxID=35708 RepID=A0A0A9GES1_ARUDO